MSTKILNLNEYIGLQRATSPEESQSIQDRLSSFILWKITTVLTIILSIASIFLFNSLTASASTKNEIIYLDTNKTKLFNIFKTVELLPKNTSNSTSDYTKSEDYHKNILNISVEDDVINNNIAKLGNIEKDFNFIQEELHGKLNVKNFDTFSSYSNNVYQYIFQNNLNYQQLSITHSNSLKIKQEIYKLSQISDNFTESSFKDLDLYLEILKSQDLLEPYFEEVVTQWKHNRMLYKEYITNLATNTEYKDNYNSIFVYNFSNQKNLNTLENSEKKIYNSLQSFQVWEKDVANNSKDLSKILVFIET